MSGTILLADDSLTIQKVVELTFADTDYRVVAVSSGDELLAKLGDVQPNLIICDVIMPGKDGYEVCQEIKSSSEWLHLPVILLTGTFEPFDRDRAIAAGCSEIITKPFEARKLVDTVERLIGSPEIATPREPVAEEWPDDATPTDVPTGAEDEDFGTQLSAPPADADGIEFTTSGFAEMEAAGRRPATPDEPDTGLDYEVGDGPEGRTDDAAEEVAAETVRIDVTEFAPDAAPVDDVPPVEDKADTEPGPFETADEAVATGEAESETGPAGEFRDESSMADTSPVEPPEDVAAAAEGAQGEPMPRLSDEDIDRIARRVVDLAADRLDQIAWEVVPDMAEIVVRQRIRELEAEADASTPEPVQ